MIRYSLLQIEIKIRNYLLNLDINESTSEYQLLKFFFNDIHLSDNSNKDLFYKHFIVYHSLYKIQFYLYKNFSYFLYFDSLYIKIFKIPHKKKCGFFDIEKKDFCILNSMKDSIYCPFHTTKQVNQLFSNELRNYYFDLSNIENITDEKLENLFESFWKIVLDIDYYKEQLNVLNLSDPFNKVTLKNNFRYLIKQSYFKDRDESEKYITAYNFLKKLIID